MSFTHSELRSIEERVGSPFFILSTQQLEENITAFATAFQQHYEHSRVAYSYKTNYIPRVCARVDALGAFAEVVSDMEYSIALRTGVDPRRIVFNGPAKTFAHLEQAVTKGSMVNLDSPAEVELLKAVAASHNDRALRVGLRVNFKHAADAPYSRFGFSVENGDFGRAVATVSSLDNVVLEGLHCHFRVPGRTPEGYGRVAETMLALAAEHVDQTELRYIDIGGGFFSRMPPEFARQFETPVPTYQDYADAIAPKFSEFFSKSANPPLLIMEPGTAVAADIMAFATRIMDVKSLPDRRLAMTDGSAYNIKPTMNRMNLPVAIAAVDPAVDEVTVDVVGYTCKEDDVMYRGLTGRLAQGDYLVFNNVGSYTVVLQPPFIRPAPPIVELTASDLTVVRRAQTLDDVLSNFSS